MILRFCVCGAFADVSCEIKMKFREPNAYAHFAQDWIQFESSTDTAHYTVLIWLKQTIHHTQRVQCTPSRNHNNNNNHSRAEEDDDEAEKKLRKKKNSFVSAYIEWRASLAAEREHSSFCSKESKEASCQSWESKCVTGISGNLALRRAREEGEETRMRYAENMIRIESMISAQPCWELWCYIKWNSILFFPLAGECWPI